MLQLALLLSLLAACVLGIHTTEYRIPSSQFSSLTAITFLSFLLLLLFFFPSICESERRLSMRTGELHESWTDASADLLAAQYHQFGLD
eukprot:m.227097 g.227097  ORF g.227097 m.227097 type:complete len:89 (+) comp54236_c2_seq24:451-717(+)